MISFDLPTQYEPYDTLFIGTNTLRGVKALASVGSNVPFLIGKGPTPRVWLSIPMDKTGTRWYPLIKDNFPSHPDVHVEATAKSIYIHTPQGTVLNASLIAGNFISIQKLNLRFFGINIYADEESLQVMGQTFTRSEFSNTQVVIGVGISA